MQLELDFLSMELAIKRLGGQSAVARQVVAAGLRDRISPQAIGEWVRRGYAPPDVAVWLEAQAGIDRVHLIDPKFRILFQPQA